MDELKSCASCCLCGEELQGYSAHTITGSTYTCLINKNPKFPLDDEIVRGEREQAEVLEFADECPEFEEGTRFMIGLYDSVKDGCFEQDVKDWRAKFERKKFKPRTIAWVVALDLGYNEENNDE